MTTYEMSYIENGAIRKFKTHDFNDVVTHVIQHDLKITDVEKVMLLWRKRMMKMKNNELYSGQKCWLYDDSRIKPKKAFIIGKFEPVKDMYSVLIDECKEPTVTFSDFIFTEKEKLLDRMEEDVDYLKYMMKEIKKETDI